VTEIQNSVMKTGGQNGSVDRTVRLKDRFPSN